MKQVWTKTLAHEEMMNGALASPENRFLVTIQNQQKPNK